MSLFSSLTTAVSGLNAQQSAIGNISDNVANAQTVGFKEIGTSFENLVTDSNQNFNQPGGVLAKPVYENSLAGNLVSAQYSTDLAISGNGFFQVKAPPSTTAGTATGSQFASSNYYTRRGDFQINNQGYLVNGAGYYLEGYAVNPQTNVVNNANGSAVPIQVTQLLDNPVATTKVTLNANLPSSYPVVGATNYTSPAPVSEQLYDAFGNTHQASIQFDHTATNTWTASITLAGATNPAATFTLKFGDGTTTYPTSSGGTYTPAAGTLASITETTVPAQATSVAQAATTGTAATFTIPYAIGAATQPLTFNFGQFGVDTGLTQFADSQVNVSSIVQDGIPRGSFQSLSIDNNGNVALNYSNGQSLTYFQIPIAQFNAPNQLQRLDGSAFSATQGSGAAQLSQANDNGAGSISSSTLEQSNVDIASEFTKLITAQNVYSANSKVITTDNQLLQTIINVIQ
ncbi:flagellar hook protein FlgE [Aliidongia dinghuensis]|uniref:Flagellar hook protein FlgE n=1 Tax=Aliidongia dinghuensis TaxID=1867774 RepID=A0A8J2YUY7_9PROT|nr:flagellar hook protein FlgE [Aliidongia dinghuensis]GGF21493.1 flagellar hook protein FlgE [Aliidongia dinghuensis]